MKEKIILCFITPLPLIVVLLWLITLFKDSGDKFYLVLIILDILTTLFFIFMVVSGNIIM